jgi:hypothetical protein
LLGVLERVVEYWLTNAGERTYEIPFAQLLIAEDYTLLHGPVHHAFEHGKDIIAYSPAGELCAFQLKGGDIGLAELDQHQGQLLTLVSTAITYPGVEPPRRPDRAFLVTNGELSPPARDRLAAINTAQRGMGLGLLAVIEKEQLISRFRKAYGQYIPTEANDLNVLFQLLTHSGESPPAVSAFFALQNSVIKLGSAQQSKTNRRAYAAALLLTAYAVGPFERRQNHLGVAYAWLALAAAVLSSANVTKMPETDWADTYALAMQSARSSLIQLLEEATDTEDLVIPHLADGFVYGSRAALVCGFVAALFLSARMTDTADDLAQKSKQLLKRELRLLRIDGEAAVPLFLLIASALDALGEPSLAANLVANCAHTLVTTNAPGSEDARPDPYHSLEDCLKFHIGERSIEPSEAFAGRSFGLPLAVDWLSRRNLRSFVEPYWRGLTDITLCEYTPGSPTKLFSVEDDAGLLRSWHVEQPQSWGQLAHSAQMLSESDLPHSAWSRPEFIPFLGCILPYRFTSSVAKAVDYYAGTPGIVEVDFEHAAG